jgi:hypothetical protein
MTAARTICIGLGFAVATSVALASCTSILGVVDLKRDTDDAGTAGKGGAAGSSSTSSSGGATTGSMGGAQGTAGSMTGAGGSQGGSGTGGSSPVDAGAGGAGTGGRPPDAGVDARADVESGPLTITVTGKVIDVLRKPYPSIPVAIGNVVTATDAQGAFRVTGVTPPYDVALTVSDRLESGWYFVGLTVPSPVLQVNTEAGPRRGITTLRLDIANPPPTFPPPNESVGYSWGSPDGSASYLLDTPGIETGPSWNGPASTAIAAHVLAWMIDAKSMPTSYVGYDTTNLTLQDGVSTQFTLDLAKAHPGTSTVSGTITVGTLSTPHDDVYVTLPKGAYIKLASEDRDPANKNFTYNVPTGIAGEGIMICAQAGSWVNYPVAHAHKRAMPGQTGIALTVPDPATLIAPGANAVVSTSTDFSWSAPAGQQGPILYTLHLTVGDSPPPNHVYVVTTNTTGRIPKFPAGLGAPLLPNVSGFWFVETSPYASVDAAATAAGFIDPFDDSATPAGPLDTDGSHAWSASRTLKTSASP